MVEFNLWLSTQQNKGFPSMLNVQLNCGCIRFVKIQSSSAEVLCCLLLRCFHWNHRIHCWILLFPNSNIWTCDVQNFNFRCHFWQHKFAFSVFFHILSCMYWYRYFFHKNSKKYLATLPLMFVNVICATSGLFQMDSSATKEQNRAQALLLGTTYISAFFSSFAIVFCFFFNILLFFSCAKCLIVENLS